MNIDDKLISRRIYDAIDMLEEIASFLEVSGEIEIKNDVLDVIFHLGTTRNLLKEAMQEAA